MPTTTGMSTAALPVLDRNPDIRPVMTMMAMMSWRSDLANLVTRPPILLAMPVSNSACPTTNMATQRITLESTYPANACLGSRTPVTHRPTETIVAVRPKGIFSSTNIMIANARKQRVITVGFTGHCLLLFLILDIVSNMQGIYRPDGPMSGFYTRRLLLPPR